MKIVWLGQAGFFIQELGKNILIDPYLSNGAEGVGTGNVRRTPINPNFLKIKPDYIIITHEHADHYDEDTLKHYLQGEEKVTVLSPYSVWEKVRKFGGNSNYVLFNSGTEWSDGTIVFSAVCAEHSDKHAVGVIICDGINNYYFAGDTLYSNKVLASLPNSIFAAFVPVNGRGNNMNQQDALRFCAKISAVKWIPTHFGMFDDIEPQGFSTVPIAYEEINL